MLLLEQTFFLQSLSLGQKDCSSEDDWDAEAAYAVAITEVKEQEEKQEVERPLVFQKTEPFSTKMRGVEQLGQLFGSLYRLCGSTESYSLSSY